MLSLPVFRRFVLSITVLLGLAAALPAWAAKLVPEKATIAVGETTYVRLDADFSMGAQWSASGEGKIDILSADTKGATVKGVAAGPVTITAKWLTGKKSTQIRVGDGAASKDQPEDDREAVRMEGLARAMGMPDLDARIARMLFEVNTGKRSPKQFYDGLARAGGNMFDVIKVRSRLVDHPDQSFTRQVMGPTYSENGTPVEQKILTWRRQETLAAIDEVVKRFVDSGRVPADGYALIISHVGKWANQADRSLTFTGDIDFSFVSNDTALAEAMKEAYAEVIKRRTGLDPKAIDSVCTAHGKAGLEVYIGRHGMAFAEQEMKINELVDMSTGARTKQDLKEVAHQLTSERNLADTQGKELAKPVQNTEPGLSMEMARHFEHDIVGPKLFDLGNAVVKAAKYLGRSYKALNDSGGSPGDAGLAEFARRITELANAKPQTRATREDTLRLISERLGSPPTTVWDMGTNKLVLTIDQAAVERFHSEASRALWDNVRQGSTIRTNALDQRLRELLDRQNKGDKVDDDVAKLRQEMVDMVDMVEAEVKAAHGADVPIEVHTNNAKVRAMLDTLSKRFGVKALSAEELKDKKFVEELLKAEMAHPDPSRLKMIAGYVMERTARAAELSMAGVEKANQLLDFIDNRYMGPLRGDADFAEFEAEMRQVQQAARDPRLRSDSTTRLGVVKTKVASAIKGTNLYLNEKLQATAAGRQGMKFMMVYGLVDEMQAYRDAFNENGWGGFATEIFKRRIPFGGAVESAVMGNTLRAGWDVVTTLIPPLALPEAAYGLGTTIGTQVKSTYWNEQLSLFTDGLYADAIFKLEEVQTYENAKVGQYRLVRTFHNNMPLDLHRFAEMRKDQVEALGKEVEAGHVNWQAYKNNFKGFTEWLDVDATLKNNLAASDPALQLLEEMASHPAVGPRLMERLAEKGLARWEQVKLGYVTKLIKHLEDRKQADDALARGMLPDLFAELRKVAVDLAIEDEVLRGLDAEVDTSNLKALVKWLWDVKRATLSQAPTESETTRAAQAVKKYLDAYKQVQALRDQATGTLGKAGTDVNTRYLTSNLFLTGRADADLATARAWIGQIETARKAMAGAILAIKRSFLPKAGLDSADQPYLDRAFAHEVWIKPYQDGNARLKKAWMNDYASGHVKERDKVLAEYKDWLTKLGPVQLTVTATDAKDAKKRVSGLKIALVPTDELGKPVSASAAGNQVVLGVPMGRYALTASAPGYYDATRNVVYGRGLTATPSEAIALTPTGKDPDKDKDKDKDKDGKPDDTTGGATNGTTGVGPDGKRGPAKQGAGGSASGQFPGEPFNGMQISYSFSGCSLPEMTDKPGFTTARSYKGRLGSGSMTVSGTARMGAGYGATLSVSVNAGGEHKEYTTYIKSGFPSFNTASFNLTIPIPATATAGGFGIRMDGEYNAGGRGLVVSGSCSADGPEGAAPKGTGELDVSISGPSAPVPLGKEADVSASAKGGRFPYTYVWTGAVGNNESAKARITRPGSQQVAVTVSDSEGKRAGANLTIKVAPLRLELAGLPNQATYGSRNRLEVKGLPDFQAAPDPCAGREYTGSSPFDECLKIRNVPVVKAASPSGVPVPAPTVGAASVGAAPARTEAREGAYRFIWQSEPGLSFEPPISSDGATWVTFDRMGQVKVWCEVLQMIEGAWQTIGETDQKTVNVVAPAFSLQFTPPDGQGKVGQEVRAKIVAKPEVSAKLIDYRWFEPASSNRMEYTDNASEIGFKVKDARPMKLEALARVPHYGDEIAKITGSYTGVAYEVTISPPKARGPQLQVWVCDTQLGNARKCGMKDIPEGQFVTFQDIFLAARVTPAPQSPRYRWTVDPSGSCGLPGSGSELRLNCSNTGSYAVHLQVYDADNILLGQADGAVSVSVNDNDVRQAPKSKEAYDKMQQAKQQADQGQLDEAITLAGAAAGLDPKNAEAKDLGKRWSDERNTVRQQVDRARNALQKNKPDDAQKAVEAAKKLHPKYPPVLEVEKQIADKRKGLASKPPVGGTAQPGGGAGGGGKPISSSGGGASLSLDSDVVEPGGKVTLRWSAPADTPDNAWVGLIPTDTPHGRTSVNDQFDMSYQYIGKVRSGTMTFTAPASEGSYDLRLSNPANDRELASLSFRVDVAGAAASLRLAKSVFAPGEALEVDFTASPGYPKNSWVGLIPSETPHGKTSVNDQHDLAYRYVDGRAQGKMSFTAPGREGSYDLRMNETSNDREVATVSFKVAVPGEGTELALDKAAFKPGETIRLHFKASGLLPRNSWVGLIPPDTPHGKTSVNDQHDVAYRYLDGRTAGELEFTAPASEGRWDFRLNETSNDREIASLTFRVDKNAPAQGTPVKSTIAAGASTRPVSSAGALATPAGSALSVADLTARSWRFGRSDGSVVAEPVRLTAAGRMQGYSHPNEDNWALENGVLVFRNPAGQVVTRFTSVRNEGGRLVLSGPYQYDSSFQHVLTEVSVDAGMTPVQPGGRDYTGIAPVPGGPASGHVRVEACVDGSDWIRIENGRLSHQHRAFDQIGSHGSCPPSHRIAGGGFLVDGQAVSLNRLPMAVGIAGIGRVEVERGRGQVRLDDSNRVLIDDDGAGGADVYVIRLYPATAAPGLGAGVPAGLVTAPLAGSPGLRLERTVYTPGEPIAVQFTAPATWPGDAWVGIVPSAIPHGDERQNDNHDIAYQYLNKRTSGTLTFTAPAAGEWDFRLHDTDNNGKEHASVSFRVGAAAQPGGRDYTGQAGGARPGQVIVEVGNIGGVASGPSRATSFTLATPHMITLIRDYHWNSARGATPGSIALRDASGRLWGPWPASGSPGQGGVPNAYWTAYPQAVLPAGTYTVIDSDPASWSHNAESNNRGFVRVEGYPSNAEPGTPSSSGSKSGGMLKEVDELLDAVKSLKGLFGK